MTGILTLPWTSQPLHLADSNHPTHARTLGTLWCADGDGVWTILLVEPGQEFKFRPPTQPDAEMDAELEMESPYGSGWGRIGGTSKPGCYIFDQGRLVTAMVHVDNCNPVKEGEPFNVQEQTAVGLALAEHLMLQRVPGLYEHLLFEDAEPVGLGVFREVHVQSSDARAASAEERAPQPMQ